MAITLGTACEKTKAVKETPAGGSKQKAAAKLTVSSSAFEAGKPIPKKHAYKEEGENISPALSWSGAPSGTKSFAVICDDPDAPSPKKPRPNPWVHWVVYNIPPDRSSLAEGETGDGTVGKNDFKETGWGGPMPPPGSGTHRYFFKVYALDTALDLAAETTKEQLIKAMEGHILAQGQVFGTYVRE
ncbi:MAG: YbhB/YbcL family Raf kinase inhibitor-like protein [Planctomycetota bacterium]